MKKIVVLLVVALLPFSIAHAEYKISDGFKRDAIENAPRVVRDYGWMVRSAGSDFSFSPIVAFAVIITETHGKENAKHDSTAECLMGVKPELVLVDFKRIYRDNVYFADTLDDPHDCIRAGVAYLAALRDHWQHFDSLPEILVAYKEGPGAAQKMTQDEIYNHPYVKKVLWIMSLNELPTH